jgi:hypothetical protein
VDANVDARRRTRTSARRGNALTPGELEGAKDMRVQGLTWAWIARYYQTTVLVLRLRLDPEYKQNRHIWTGNSYDPANPIDVLEEREKPPPLLYKDKLLSKLREVHSDRDPRLR